MCYDKPDSAQLMKTERVLPLNCTPFIVILMLLLSTPSLAERICQPTPHDEIGPFYKPNAPVRSKIGTGYVLSGRVLDTSCRPISGARIEFWQTGPDGAYSDNLRATVYPDAQGRYRLETVYPQPYARRPSHIHILVDGKGLAGLITQHYPILGKRKARFDLILERE